MGGMEIDTFVQVLDDWGPPSLVRAIDVTWPDRSWPHWHKYNDHTSVKYATKDAGRLTPAASLIVGQMASRLDYPDCFPDLELHGAGMHCIPPRGFLERHLDGEVHPLTGWKREANAILFVAEWDEGWGGALCFHNKAGDVVRRVTPKFNRLVRFDTTSEAWHSVEPVTGPKDRRSVSLFWWSSSKPTCNREKAEFQCTSL